MKSHRTDRDALIAFANGGLSQEESIQILTRLESDPELSQELEEILALTRALDQRRPEEYGRLRMVRENMFQYGLRLVAVLIIAMVTTIAISEALTGQYYELARVEQSDLVKRFRAIDDDRVKYAIMLYTNGEHDAAIQELEREVAAQPQGPAVDVLQIILGEMLLVSADQNWIGLFPGYDTGRVDRAMEYLAHARESMDARVAEEALWLRMKGFLMLGDREGAVREGKTILKNGRERINSAKALLSKITNE